MNSLHRHYRTYAKIATALVLRGGLFDRTHKYNGAYYHPSVHRKTKFYTQIWREAKPLTSGLIEVLRYGVPMWFIERHMSISRYFLWEKQEFSGYGTVDKSCASDVVFIGAEDFIPKMYDIAEYKKGVHCVYTSNSIKIIPIKIIAFWEAVRDRYLSIYGLDCKMCKKHKKGGSPICSDLSKYAIHICPDCLKKFCKLNEDSKMMLMK